MDIGERIKQRRTELKLSQEELSLMLGYSSRTSVSKIELGERKVPIEKVAEIAKALQTTSAWLMGWKSAEDKFMDTTLPVKSKSIPMLGKISCGKPSYANEEVGTEVSTLSSTRADFCLVAKGDSMINARIFDGDIVFVRKDVPIQNGDIAVVIVGDEATLKRVYFDADKHKMILQAENSKYQPLVFVGDELKDVAILGKAVALQTKLN